MSAARVLATVALAAFLVSLGAAVLLGLGDEESAAVRPPVPTTGTTTPTREQPAANNAVAIRTTQRFLFMTITLL